MAIRKADLKRKSIRMCLCGPSKSGKTWNSLRIATAMIERLSQTGSIRRNGRICGMDSENDSMIDYSDEFDFDYDNIYEPTPLGYMAKIQEMEHHEIGIVDSITHEWKAVLDKKDRIVQSNEKNQFTVWGKLTPEHDAFVNSIIHAPFHIICTARADMEYAMSTVDGKTQIEKLGLQPTQRKNIEYEFDIWGNIDSGHSISFAGTRCRYLSDRIFRPHEVSQIGIILADWVSATKDLDSANSIIDADKIRELKELGAQLKTDWLKTFQVLGIGSFDSITETHYTKLKESFEKTITIRKSGRKV